MAERRRTRPWSAATGDPGRSRSAPRAFLWNPRTVSFGPTKEMGLDLSRPSRAEQFTVNSGAGRHGSRWTKRGRKSAGGYYPPLRRWMVRFSVERGPISAGDHKGGGRPYGVRRSSNRSVSARHGENCAILPPSSFPHRSRCAAPAGAPLGGGRKTGGRAESEAWNHEGRTT